MDEKELDLAVEDIADDLGFETDASEVNSSSETTETTGDAGNISTGEVDSTGETEVEAGTETQVEGEVVESSETVSSTPPPKTWRPDAAKEWEKLPSVVQEEILKREEDMFKGIEGYKQEAAIGKVVRDIVSPYLPQLQSAGIDPIHQIQSLLHAHHTLVNGTDAQRTEVFRHLLKEYNVDISGTAEIFQDPATETLNKTVANLQRKLDSFEQGQAEQVRESLRQEIAAFSADPVNAHFDLVIDDMTALLKAGLAKDLSDAYAQAVWRNPQTRALETARLAAETEAKLKRETEGKVTKLIKATSANVKTSAKAGSGTTPLGSMDDTLNETLQAIKSRA